MPHCDVFVTEIAAHCAFRPRALMSALKGWRTWRFPSDESHDTGKPARLRLKLTDLKRRTARPVESVFDPSIAPAPGLPDARIDSEWFQTQADASSMAGLRYCFDRIRVRHL